MANVVKDFAQLISQSKDKKTGPYDTQAVVKRIEGNTVWVSIPGGIDETPIEKTINCTAGDKVQVRVSGGKAWITGNASAPPTDDTTAIKADTTATKAQVMAIDAKETADAVEGIAVNASTNASNALHIAEGTNEHFWHDSTGAHITEVTQDEWNDPGDPNYHSGGNTLITTQGMAIRNGLSELATFSANGAKLGVDGYPQTILTTNTINIQTKEGVSGFSVDTSGVTSTETRQVNIGEVLYSTESATYDLSGITPGTSVTFNVDLFGQGYYETATITIGTSSSGNTQGGDVEYDYAYDAGANEMTITAAYGEDLYVSFYRYNVSTYKPLVILNGVININGNTLSDYVVDEGTASGWLYRKWSSGKIELWTNDTKTVSCTSAFASTGAYYSGAQTYNLPTTLGINSITQYYGSGAPGNQGWIMIASASTTSLSWRAYNRTSNSSCSVTLNFYVVGTYA